MSDGQAEVGNEPERAAFVVEFLRPLPSSCRMMRIARMQAYALRLMGQLGLKP